MVNTNFVALQRLTDLFQSVFFQCNFLFAPISIFNKKKNEKTSLETVEIVFFLFISTFLFHFLYRRFGDVVQSWSIRSNFRSIVNGDRPDRLFEFHVLRLFLLRPRVCGGFSGQCLASNSDFVFLFKVFQWKTKIELDGIAPTRFVFPRLLRGASAEFLLQPPLKMFH